MSLVLQGLSAHKAHVKDDKDAVKGLVGLFDKLVVWRAAARRTNEALQRAVDAANQDRDPRRALSYAYMDVADAGMAQSVRLVEVERGGHGYGVEAGIHLFRLYAPTTADALASAFRARQELIDDLGGEVQRRYKRDGVRGLQSLVNEAEVTERLLNEAVEMLRTFIQDNVPLDRFTGDAAWVRRHL
jgi:hypothetical protein